MTLTLNFVPNTLPPVQLPAGMVFGAFLPKVISGDKRLFRESRTNVANEDMMHRVWRENREAFLRRGFCTQQKDHVWYLTQWLRPHGSTYTLTPIGQGRLDLFLNPPVEEGPIDLPPPEFGPLPAGLESKLYGYQVQPTRQLYRSILHGKAEWGYPGGADLSSMGLGKTYTCIAAALATGRIVCVLCPSVGQEGWKRAFAHFGAVPHFIGTYEAVRGAFREHIATMNETTGEFHWKRASDIILIMDEAQAVRHPETLTFRCCSAAIRQGIPIIVASATIATSPLEMRFAGRITGLHAGETDWDRFRFRHGCFRESKSGPWKWDRNPKHLEKIHRELFPRRGCRMRKEDLGTECPETEIELLPIDVEDSAAIEAEWIQAMRTIENLKRQHLNTTVQEQRARMAMWQRCELALVPHIAKRVRDDVLAGHSVAVFCSFDATRKTLGDLLKTHDGFYGGQNIKTRQYIEREFQEDRKHILINNIKAGGASVSLHDVKGWRSRKAYIFPTDHVIDMVQATGRVDRVGGKSKSQQYIPYVRGSMTQRMVERTRVKMRSISALNDGADAGEDRF